MVNPATTHPYAKSRKPHYGSTDERVRRYTDKEVRYAIEKDIPVPSLIISDQVKWNHEKSEDNSDNRVRLKQFKNLLSADRLDQAWSSRIWSLMRP